MREINRSVEKILIPAAFAFECFFSGSAFAQTRQIEYERRYEMFGEGLRIFEQEIDETNDDEFRAMGIIEDTKSARIKIKRILPIIWKGFSKKEWDQLPITFACVRYNILNEGVRFYYEYSAAKRDKDSYSYEDYHNEQVIINKRVADETGLQVQTSEDQNKANSVINFFEDQGPYFSGAAGGPSSSFSTFPGVMRVSSVPLSAIYLFLVMPPFSKQEANNHPYQQFPLRAIGIKKFVHAHSVALTVAHELGHIVGLAHADSFDRNDIMSESDFSWVLTSVPIPTGTPSYDVYVDHELGEAFKISFKGKRGAENDSFKLTRWLRFQAVKGKLESLLRKAEELAVKRPLKKQERE